VLLLIPISLLAVFFLWQIASVLRQWKTDAAVQHLLAIYGSAAAASRDDAKRLLVWYPMAMGARKLFPEAAAQLDAQFGAALPLGKEQIQAAHARCSSEWLAWERAHNAEYSVKTAQLEDEITRAGGHASPLMRTRLAALEQEKLERYQQRYEDYVRTSKALAALDPSVK